MINSLNFKEIKNKIDLNTSVSSEEINFLWNALNFKLNRFWNNGFKFKYK